MKLVLKNSAGESVSLQIKQEETFLELKERVEAEVGVSLDLKVIAIRGKKIIETQKVVDYFIGDKAKAPSQPTQNYQCSVPGCLNTKATTPDRCFFRFPEEEVRCHQWVLYCQRLNMMSGKHRLNLTSESSICSDHFRQDQFVKNTSTLLKRTAVPCVNPELPISDSTVKRSSFTPYGKCQLIPVNAPSAASVTNIDPTGILTSYALTGDTTMITLVANEDLDLDTHISFPEDARDPLAISDEDILKDKSGHKELVCRLCAALTDSYIFIFDNIGESLGLAQKINECLPIEVKATDHLPKQICRECYIKLVEVYDLAELCLQSDAKFSNIHAKDYFRAEELYTFPVNLLHNCFDGIDTNTLNLCSKIYGCPLCKDGKMSSNESRPSSPIPVAPAPLVLTVEPSLPSGMYIHRNDEPSCIDNDNTSSCGSFLTNEYNNSYNFTRDEVTAKDIDEILNKPLNVDLPSFGLDNKFVDIPNCSPIFDSSESLGLDDYKQPIEFVDNKSPLTVQPIEVDPLKSFSEDSTQSKSNQHSSSPVKPHVVLSTDKYSSGHDDDSSTNESSKTLKVRAFVSKKHRFPFHCETCGLRFRKTSTMLSHGCLEPLVPNNKCNICYKTFRSDARLIFHMKFHRGAKPGYCEICQKSFPDETKLYKHTLYLHGGEKSHCCEECGKVFRSISSLRYHQRTHLGESIMKPFSCDQCGKCFIRKSMLKNHITAVHHFSCLEECCFTCKVCNEAFPATDLAISHMERWHVEESSKETYSFDMHTVSRLYICEYCDRSFAEGSSLNKHRDRHSVEMPYECKCCGCCFSSFAERGAHNLEVHHNISALIEYSSNFTVPLTYLCEYCDRCFSNYIKFSEHLTIHFGNEPYSCRYCNARMATLSEAVDHRSTHSEAQEPTEEFNFYRPYECHYCSKAFAIEDALVKHIRMHTGEKPFICDQCGKGFSQSSGLYTHQKVHSNLRPYVCDMCPRTFKIKGDRDVHVRKHSGDRPYKCEFCGKAFMTQHVYSQHRKIHTGERPYKCDVCGIAFRRSHVLTVHKRIHTGEKPNVCDVCGKRYRQKGDMLKHRRIQHGVLKVQLQKMLPNPVAAT